MAPEVAMSTTAVTVMPVMLECWKLPASDNLIGPSTVQSALPGRSMTSFMAETDGTTIFVSAKSVMAQQKNTGTAVLRTVRSAPLGKNMNSGTAR
jgi:hypothetical protein